MPIVAIPDKDMRIRFPDDMSPEAIEEAIRTEVYGGYALPQARAMAEGLREEEEKVRARERSLFPQQPRTEVPDKELSQMPKEQVRDIASQLGREATARDIKEYAAYVPYLATKALHGLTGWVFEPFQDISTDKMSPMQKATVQALGGADNVLETATEYWKKTTGGKDIEIPNATIGRNEDGSLAIKPAEPISLRETLGTTAEFAGEVMGPIKGALSAGHEAAELTAKYARPFYRSIMRGMVGGALLGEGKKDETLQNMALFGVFEPLAYSIGKVPELPGIIKESTPWRRMNIKERGLVLQSLDDMIQKNPNMGEAEILKRWNNPQWRKEALERRTKPLSEAERKPPVRTAETGMKGVTERTGKAMLPAASSRVTIPPREAPTTQLPTGPVMEAEAPPETSAAPSPEARKLQADQKARENKRELARNAKDFRNWVRWSGGIQKKDATWKGELKDLGGKGGLPPWIFSKEARGMDELTQEAVNEGWLPPGATEDDFMEALAKNPEHKITHWESEENLDKLIQQEDDRIAQWVEDLKNEGYSEDDIREIISGSEAEEAAAVEKRISGQEEAIDEDGFNWSTGEYQEPVLTPEEPTPYEKAARLEREGAVKFPEKSKSEAVFPEEGIKTVPGKQKGLFGPQKGENQELFSMKAPGGPQKAAPSLPKKGVVFRTQTNRSITKKDPDWLAAKTQADRTAAAKVADRLWTEGKSKQIGDSLKNPKSAVIISVPSTSRRNVLPDVLADRIAQDIGATAIHGAEIFRALHEEESKNVPKTARWKHPREYELAEGVPIGKLRGREIVVADDIFTSGGSAKDFIHSLIDKGLQVSNVAGYFGDSRLKIDPQTYSALKKAIRGAGLKIKAKDLAPVLTRKEARDIIWQKLRQVKTDAAREKLTQDLQRLLDRRAPEDARHYQQGRAQRPFKRQDSGHGRPAEGVPSGTVREPAPQPSRKSVEESQPPSGGFTPIPEGKRRSAILKKASKTLEVPIRTGKFRTRRGALKAAGIYKPGAKVIRLARANDLETAIHEIGHHIESLLGLPEEMPPQVQAMAYEGARDADREGFAEFLRYYVTAPRAAREGAPEFYERFEQALEAQPEVREIITKARNAWNVWQQSPSVAKVHSFIQRGKTGKAMPTLSQVYTSVKDSLYPLQQAVKAAEGKGATITTTENPYLMARLTRGWARKAEQYLKYRPFQYDPKQGAVFSGKSLKEILEPIEKAGKTELLDTYLVAKRAVYDPRIQEGFSGILSMRDFIQTVKELEPEFKETAKDLYQYSDQLLTFLTQSGRISEETAEAIRSKNLFYVPFYRVMDWEAPLGGLSSKRFSNLFNPVKRLKGSSRDIYSPTESLVYNTFVTINAAERNRVGNALQKLAEKPGMGAIIEKLPPRIKPVRMSMEEALKSLTGGISDPVEKQAMKETLSAFPKDILRQMVTAFRPNYTPKQNEALFYSKGDPVLYEISPDLARAIGNINATDVGMLTRAMSYPAKWLRAGATTFSPEFAIRNPIRDQMTAYIQTKYGFKPGYDILRGLYHMIGKTDLWQKFNASGAAHSAIVSLDRNYISKNLKDMLMKGSVKGMVRHPLELLQAVSEYTEEATRVGEFARGLKKEGESYEAMLKAGIAGREVSLDFARQGQAWARAANLISAFWNARMEGIDKLVRTFKENPVKAFAKAFLGVTLPSILIWFAQRDDPYYQEIPAWRRTLFWNFVLHNGDGTLKHIISIPKPFEYGLIFGSIPESALDWAYSQDPGAFNETMKSFGKTFNLLPIPTGLVPLGEWWANKSWFFDRPIVSRGKEDLEPVLQYSEHTAETTKLIAKMMDQVPGLREIASPAKIENLIRGYTGGFGRLAVEAGDWLIKTLGVVDTPPDPRMTLSDIPGIRGFSARFPSANTRSIETFYRRYTDLNRKWESQKQRLGVRGTGVRVGAPRKLQEYTRVAKALSVLRKMADRAYRSEGLKPKAKREYLDNIYLCMANVARSALNRPANLKAKRG